MSLFLNSLELREQIFSCIFYYCLLIRLLTFLFIFCHQVSEYSMINWQSLQRIELLDQFKAHGTSNSPFPIIKQLNYVQNYSRQGVQNVWPQCINILGTLSIISYAFLHSQQISLFKRVLTNAQISGEMFEGVLSACQKKQVVGLISFFIYFDFQLSDIFIIFKFITQSTYINLLKIIRVLNTMVNFTNTAINLYLLTTFSIFGYVCYSKYLETDNYFAGILQILDNPLTKLLIYNVIVSLATIAYKLTIAIFYVEIKENQSLNMIEKIGYKLFQLCYFLYLIGTGFGLGTFTSLTVIFLMFIFHNIAIARANFLIHTHVTENMSMNYRLLAHFLIMLFIDYELVTHTYHWLFIEVSDSSYILFAYYSISISMSIIEPAVSFFLHFYEVYTDCQIQNLDINIVKLKFIINVPRLLIQLFISALITYQFTMSFLMIFTLIQSISQISKTFKNYNSMKTLIDKMKNLKELSAEDLEKQHDRVCTVCFHDIVSSALLLPCKHIFHKQCLRQWIIKNSNHHCPKCKKSFDFENMKSVDKEQQIRRINQNFRERMAQNERADPLGFSRDDNITKKSNKKRQDKKFRQQKIDENQQNIQILKVDDNNHLAKLEQTKRKVKKQKPQGYNIGSVPFGLPTEAIYRRKPKDITQRNRIIYINSKMIKFMKMDPVKQLLFVPEFD